MNAQQPEPRHGKRCGAQKHQGERGETCQKPAGWGTDHVGVGSCRLHGGSTPSGKAAAAKVIARETVRSFGLPEDVDPQEAILAELHRTAGAVAWLTQIVGELDRDRIANGVTKIETRTGFQAGRSVTVEANVNVWVRLWQDERKHLAQVAVAAHRMGIDAAQARAIETAGQMLAVSIVRILDQLALSDQQQMIAGQVVPDVLRSLDRPDGREQLEGEIIDDGSVNR